MDQGSVREAQPYTLDADEREVLRKFQQENPKFVAFKETDNRVRTLEERFAEFEMEKVLHTVIQRLQEQRLAMSRDSKIHPLPVHPKVPFPAELRRQRNQIMQQWMKVEKQERFIGLGDVLTKEVGLTEESRNSLPHALCQLRSFFKHQLEVLPRRQFRYITRWVAFCQQPELMIAQRGALDERLETTRREIQYCADAHERIATYADALSIQVTKHSESSSAVKPDIMDDTRTATMLLQSRVPQELMTGDVRVYLRQQSFEYQTRKRWERFASKAMFIPMSKRYDLYSSCVQYLTGGAPAGGGDKADVVPRLPVDDSDVISQLDDLAGCFKLTGHDKADLLEFMYHVNKRYSAVFEAQNAAWSFQSLDPSKPKMKLGSSTPEAAEDIVYLRPTTWNELLKLDIKLPEWHETQEAVLRASVRKISAQLLAESEFLTETDIGITTARWKKRCESHMERANVRSRRSHSPTKSEDSLDELGDPTDFAPPRPQAEHVTPSPKGTTLKGTPMSQRILALSQLRYLRIREFRKTLLGILNYFASVHRAISLDCCEKAMDYAASGVRQPVAPLHLGPDYEAEQAALAPMVETEPPQAVPIDSFTQKLLNIYDAAVVTATIDSGMAQKAPPAKEDASAGASPKHVPASADAATPATGGGVTLSQGSDRYTVPSGNNTQRIVYDSEGRRIMYNWAIEQLNSLEAHMLQVATFYLARFNDEKHQTDSIDADCSAILEDLYESEVWFQEGKLKLLDGFREAYEHTVDPKEQARLAETMLMLIFRRPQFDFSDRYFTPSYTSEVINLELMYTLQREIITSMIHTERNVRQVANPVGAHTKQGGPILDASLSDTQVGLPERIGNDTKLFFSLFPGTSVVNIMDVYTSLGALSELPLLIQSAVESLASDFQVDQVSGRRHLQREITQELLVQWRLLDEEDRVVRQLQAQKANAPSNDEIFDMHAAFNDVELVDRAVQEVTQDAETIARGQRATKKRDPAASRANVADANAELPEPSPEFMGFVTAMECYSVRPVLMRSLYETELLYNVHRSQAKRMGVNVKKLQLDPIEFEIGKTLSEIDEFDNLRENMDDGEESAIGVRVELLTNLAIAEFEQSMARFDLGSFEGVKKLLGHSHADFRRALTVQVAQKNMLIGITLCNQLPLDVYFDSVCCQLWQRGVKHRAGAESDPTVTRCRLPEWTGHAAVYRYPREHDEKDDNVALKAGVILSDIDKPTLQKLYISVNQVKSVHRKCILIEMNNRTTDILNTKKPELLRRKMKELKCELVGEYCVNVMLATYQYAVKYQAGVYALRLRNIAQRHPQLKFFTLGNRNDVVRTQPRTAATSQGDSRRLPTCMITKGGKLDDARYIPHIVQILTLDFEPKERAQTMAAAVPGGSAAQGGSKETLAPHEHLHYHNQSHIRTNYLVTMLAKILYHWLGILQLTETLATAELAPGICVRTPQAAVKSWKQEIESISSELDSFRDPNGMDRDGSNDDIPSVEDFLRNQHCTLFLRLVCGLRSLRFQHLRQHEEGAAQNVLAEQKRLERAAAFVTPRATRLMWPNASLTYEVSQLRSAEVMRLKASSYVEHISRLKTMRIGLDFESTITEIENTPAGALSLGPDEAYFFEEVESNPFVFIGQRVAPPYQHLASAPLLLTSTKDERDTFVRECSRLYHAVKEANEEIAENLLRASNNDMGSSAARIEYSPIMFELLVLTIQRDRLRELYYLILRRISTEGHAAVLASLVAMLHSTKPSGKAETTVLTEPQLDELYTRNIVHKSRLLHEREMANAESEGKGRRGGRRGRGFEKELLRMQVYVLEMEINKLLLSQAMVHLSAAKSEVESVVLPSDIERETTIVTEKEGIFTDFINILTSRAVLMRDEQRVASYHIPEASLQLAISTVGKRLKLWGTENLSNMLNAMQQITLGYQGNLARVDQQVRHLLHMRDVDGKAIIRRVESRLADEHYELLFNNSSLEKENASLRHKLAVLRESVRGEIRMEYEGVIAELKRQLMLSQGQFKSYQRKLYRDMQVSLEEIKRGAMLSVGKMDNAPLHMKRQALKIAISDDEMNALKEQNAELKQAITKVKLWYEMKLLRMKAAYDKQMQEISNEVELSRTKYWDNRQTAEKERDELHSHLVNTQNQLAERELEVEQLRKDLQLQLTNKKDLVAWKVQHAKLLDELQRKMKKYEKWEQYDIEKLVSDHERLQAQEKPGGAEGPTMPSGTPRPGSSRISRRILSASSRDDVSDLKEKLHREKALKEKAFAKIDELRQGGDPSANEALVWQRKYFEAASELQRCIKDLELTRNTMIAAGVQPPAPTEAPTPSLMRSFHSAQHPSGSALPRASTSIGSRAALPPPPSRLNSSPSTRIAKLFVGIAKKAL